MNERDLVKKAADYIEGHLGEDLSLDKIASELHYSKFYLARIFAEKAGCTIYKYIQGRRLTLAAQALVETGKPIVEIACEARYGSQQAFALAFKQRYQCTPRIYREKGVFYPVQNILFDTCGSYARYGMAGYVLRSRGLGNGEIRSRIPGSHGLGGCTRGNCVSVVNGSADYIEGGAIAA